jgi:hypothetical protein
MMENFDQRQNIKNYTSQLMQETDTNRREILQKLLAEEIVKQACCAPPKTLSTDNRGLNSSALSCFKAKPAIQFKRMCKSCRSMSGIGRRGITLTTATAN